jgi:hypothetical protein
MPQLAFKAAFWAGVPKLKTLSTCAITACTSALQFFGIDWRIGSK